jgi:hypothetical protein
MNILNPAGIKPIIAVVEKMQISAIDWMATGIGHVCHHTHITNDTNEMKLTTELDGLSEITGK